MKKASEIKTFAFKILIAAAIISVAVTAVRPLRAFLFDRARSQNTLENKIAQRDSLQNVLQGIRENPNNLERVVRNSGYSRANETMLKIIAPDQERENRRLETTLILAIAAATVILLIILFAIPVKSKEKDGESKSGKKQYIEEEEKCPDTSTDTQE